MIQPTTTKCLTTSIRSRHTTKFQTLIYIGGPIVRRRLHRHLFKTPVHDYNKHNRPVITGIRNPTTGLYEQQIPAHNQRKIHQSNDTLPTTNLQEHIKYLHQCAFSPTTRTWIQAVNKGHFKTWPSVTVDAIQCYLPKSEATMLGHLDQQRKNIQSTKLHDDDQDTMHTLSPLEKGLNTHTLYAATICYNEPTGKLYTDLMG